MEAFQYMHTRLYEVLQNVQRDNHVGLPAPSLVEHLGQTRDPASDDVHAHPCRQHTRRASATAGDGTEANSKGVGGANCPRGAAPTAGAVEPGAPAPDSQTGALMPFLQTILDQIGILGSAGGMQPGAVPLAGQLLGAKEQPYPFDMAAASLFSHSLVVLELSQRGVRNPPVFSHEDSRTLPSGSLTDGVPEMQAAFMYALAKVSELHYRSVLQPLTELGGPNAAGLDQRTPAQRLHALIAESRLQFAAMAAAAPAAPVPG
ncbi:hypothetical protein H4R21_006717, partial [Coemansia helicoidea]